MPLFLAVRAAQAGSALRELELVGRDLSIGRSPDADITLPDPTQQVSSKHCQLQFRGGAYVLADSSTNGTMLNGTRVATPQRLKAGDVIGVGPYTIELSERAATTKAPDARMDLNSWDRAPARPPAQESDPGRAAPAPAPTSAPVTGASPVEQCLTQGLKRLVATRARQRTELGVQVPEPLAGNPFAGAPHASAAPANEAAVTAAVDEIERHHAAVLRAMQTAFRTSFNRISPDAIERNNKVTGEGDLRDAALWRAYVAAFNGSGFSDRSFIELFTQAFREAYQDVSRAS